MQNRLPTVAAVRFLKPSSLLTRKFIFQGDKKVITAMEMIIAEKDKRIADIVAHKADIVAEKDKRIADIVSEKDKRIADIGVTIVEKDKRIADKDDVIADLQTNFVKEEKRRVHAESRYSAVLADRNVLEVSAVEYRNQNPMGKLTMSKTIDKFMDAFIPEPTDPKTQDRALKPDAKTALLELQRRDQTFKQVSNSILAKEMAVAYHNTSQRIHFPDKSSLSEGIYVGSGSLVSRAMIAVFTSIAQANGLYDEKVRLLDDKDEHSCTISNGAFLPR
jgi:hypothetical protein